MVKKLCRVKPKPSKNLMRHVLGNKRSGGHFIATSVRARLRTLLRFLGVATSSRVFIGQLQPLSGIDIASNLFMPPYAVLNKYDSPSTTLTFFDFRLFPNFWGSFKMAYNATLSYINELLLSADRRVCIVWPT